jgi:2-dehydro-3-deoxyphosphogluconate aldolase/(4S)-4-hydroxy-2-oxoglutarate aldolase
VIAILRRVPPDALERVVAALADGGIRVVEVTLDSEDALDQLARAARPELLVGAGTVTTVEDVDRAVSAGARFCAAPTTNAAVVRRCAELGVAAIPGALTPTEIAAAVDLGAPLVKLFPAGSVGPDYVRSLAAPLGNVPIVATGGVDETNARAFLDAGAVAVGFGSSLVSRERIAGECWDELRAAAQFVVSLRPP